MARTEEKAQGMWNRWLQIKTENTNNFSNNGYGPAEGNARGKRRRPYLASECNDLNDADKFRQDILREIGRKVGEIQNVALSEPQLRELNDGINKLIREKEHWEKRIVQLGGPDYSERTGADDASGGGTRTGYRYFGAAKNLPGVKELYGSEGNGAARRQRKRTKHEIMLNIDADYYGFRDEDDGILVAAEREAEAVLQQRLIDAHSEQEAERRRQQHAAAGSGPKKKDKEISATGAGREMDDFFHATIEDFNRTSTDDKGAGADSGAAAAAAAIEEKILEKKKNELYAKYASDGLLAAEAEAKSMLQVNGGGARDSGSSGSKRQKR